MYTRLLIWLFCLTGLTISLSYHLISKYNFLEAECKNQSFLDSSGPNVSTQIGSLSYSGPCFNSNGASNIMSSRFSVPTMWSNQIKSAMSISFWIQVNKTALTQPLILLEFSSSIQNSYPSLRIGLGRSTLSSTSLQLFISISNVGLTQQTFLFSYPKPQTAAGLPLLQYVAVTFVYPSLIYVRLNVTVDGSSQKTLAGSSSFSTSSGSYSPRYWPSGNFLFLLSGSAVTLVTSTTNNALMIYYLAIYNTTLSSDDIRNRIKAGVPNSLPIPLAHTAYVQENGEVGDHSNYPEFYQTPIPSSQLAIIALTLYDFDNQPVCPNFANNKLFPPSVMVAVLPKQCLLYREDGSTIDKISPTVSANISTGIVKLRVRPAKNMFSSVHSVAPFCLFSYYAVDGITAQRSLQMANVSVFVTQVDQPPVPVQNLSATAIPHRATHVYLRANSNDKAIIRWIVLSIPMYGKLYTISKSGIVSTAPIKLLSNASSSHSINISTTGLVYIYTGTEDFGMLPSSDSSTGYLTSDYFAFSLVDTVGRESISAFFILSVHTAIQATPTDLTGKGRHDALTTQPLTVQGICSPITLYASDLSTLQRHLTISILQGPTHGRLFYDEACTEDSVTNLSGTILPPYSMGLTVYYLSDSSFFTCPSVSINGTSLNVTLDSFAFQASTTDAQSAVQMQYISVENYNHATEIQLNSSMFEPLVLRAYGAAPIGKESSMAIINGFSIIDPDTDTGFVRVQVSTLKRGGVVSLNKAALDSLDFNSAQHCLGNTRWSCTGSGFEDSVSVFVTYPSAALAALNGMTYLSTKPNILDIVNITIYDGKDGKCLDDSQQSAYSLRDGCFIRSVSFRVTVTGFAETSPVGSSFNSLDGRVKDVIISLSVLMCLFCCRCCVAGWRRAIHMKQQLGRLKKLEELESNEKKRRTSHLHTTLDTTDLDIYPSESVSQQHLVGCTTSAITKEDSVDDPVPYSVQKASRARQLLESSRPDTRSVSADTKRGDRQLHTSPSIGNRNSNISGDNLFARVAAKDIKTFSSIVPSAPTADSTKMSSVKRRSFRSEFEFRLKTEVLNGMSETQIKKVESSDDYFSRLEKQLREEESGQD